MTNANERSERARKAARTRKRRVAAKKAVVTKRRKSAARKAVATKRIELHLHDLVRRRAGEFSLPVPDGLPRLARLGAKQDWFPLPGMHGGFAYRWDPEARSPRLLVGSWSRVCGGSEQDHAIDEDGIVLLRDGADDEPVFEIVKRAPAVAEPKESGPPPCPKCKSTNVLRQFYGMPGPGEELESRPGWHWTGGCMGPVPEFYCAACEREFGEIK